MINFSHKITENYAFEIQIFQKYRQSSDGIDFLEFIIKWDRYKSDHKPSFDIRFSVFNLIIFEVNYYNIHHVKEN